MMVWRRGGDSCVWMQKRKLKGRENAGAFEKRGRAVPASLIRERKRARAVAVAKLARSESDLSCKFDPVLAAESLLA